MQGGAPSGDEPQAPKRPRLPTPPPPPPSDLPGPALPTPELPSAQTAPNAPVSIALDGVHEPSLAPAAVPVEPCHAPVPAPTLDPSLALYPDGGAPPAAPRDPAAAPYTPSLGYVSFMESLLQAHYPQGGGGQDPAY